MAKIKKDYVDFETKKGVHFNITRESHSELRILLFKKKLTLSEVFQELVHQMIEGSPKMEKLLDELTYRKRQKIIKQLSEQDAESLFSVIESDNPLSKE